MIDRATIQRVMDATDIVDVVKEFVTLRKAGVNYKGLCPFHNEKTPSFVVSPGKQMCKCFSCGKGGNAVHFLMELEHMTYPEAIKWLGKKYGIEVQEKELTDSEKEQQSERESMFALNEWASKYFQDILRNDVDGVAKGMAYFRARGFRDDTIKKFSLGYSLEVRDAMAQAALAHGFKQEYLEKTGLCYRTEDGRLLDRYHGRVIFPVHTVSGKVVAFGGRILNTEKVKNVGKYVNSPESEIYSKSRELYGLFQAKNAIVRHGRCFLVEGYTDVISMHQSGVENVVASSGTSLTEGQIRLLHRFTDNITVLYDGDAAGIKASLRGIDMLLAEGLNIKVLLLPDGDDPDSFARKHRAEDFQKYIDEHQVDFIKFKTDLLLKDAASDPIKRAELISNVVRSISVIPDNIVRQMYIRECATNLSVGEDLIVNEINKQLRNNASKDKDQTSADKEPKGEQPESSASTDFLIKQQAGVETAEEKLLMSLIVKFGNLPIYAQMTTEENTVVEKQESVAEYIAADLQADGIELSNEVYRQMLQEAVEHVVANSEWNPLLYFSSHPNAQISQLASDLGQENFILSSKQKAQYVDDKYRLDELVPRILHDYKHTIIKKQLKSILQEMRDPQVAKNPERMKELMRIYMDLSALEREFAKILGDRVVLKYGN